MDIVNNFPKEFFLGDFYPIEKTRQIKFDDCWSISMASAIGDSFTIANNLEPIYLSSIYLLSQINDICNYFNKNKNCQLPLTKGCSILHANIYLEQTQKGLKLNRCFPYEESSKYLLQNGYDKYNELTKKDNITYPKINKKQWFKGHYYIPENINNLCPSGCINDKKCQNTTEYKNKFEVQIKPYSATRDQKHLKNLNEYTENDIKNIQNIMKHFIFNLKKPIVSGIYYTEELAYFFLNKKNNYFSPQTKLNNQRNSPHAVVILGWELKDNKEYWIIRDTLVPDIFLKIEFSKFSNKDYWISLDIKWKEGIGMGQTIVYNTKGYYDNSNLQEYLKEGIFKKKAGHDEL